MMFSFSWIRVAVYAPRHAFASVVTVPDEPLYLRAPASTYKTPPLEGVPGTEPRLAMYKQLDPPGSVVPPSKRFAAAVRVNA
jgi:hypothetical protein